MSWNILTDRQKSLDRAIEQCGVKLDNSDACFRRVMNAIGGIRFIVCEAAYRTSSAYCCFTQSNR